MSISPSGSLSRSARVCIALSCLWVFGVSPWDLRAGEKDEAEIKRIEAQPRLKSGGDLEKAIRSITEALRAGLDDESKEDAEAFLKKYPGNSAALSTAAAAAWVQSCPGSSLLLAAEAARSDVKNTNAVCVLASLLVQAGYPHKGVPVLEYLVDRFPNDPTALNNLGQAWLDVGEDEKASVYFLRCVAAAPNHAAAHAGLAKVAQAAGQTDAAQAHMKIAAESSGSTYAEANLSRANVTFDLPRSTRLLFRMKEYFNPSHFRLPALQMHLEEKPSKAAEVEAFKTMVMQKHEQALAQASQLAERIQMEMMKLVTAPRKRNLGVFDYSAMDGLGLQRAIDDYHERFSEFINRLSRLKGSYDAIQADLDLKIAAARKEYEDRWGKQMGEGKDVAGALKAREQLCEVESTLTENALGALNTTYNDFIEQNYNPLRVYANDAMGAISLMSWNPAVKPTFYSIEESFLRATAMAAEVMPLRSKPCTNVQATTVKVPDEELPALDCPFSLKLDLVVTTLKADCTSVSFTFEAGLSFKAKKDFVSGETTLTGGVGVNGKVAQASGGVVITWDKGNHVRYVGVETNVSASISGIEGLSGKMDTSDIAKGTSVSVQTRDLMGDIASVSNTTNLGVTIGPSGAEPTIGGKTGASVLGEDIFEAKL